MKELLYRNPDYKSIVLKLVFVSIIMLILFQGYAYLTWEAFNQEVTMSNIATIGSIIEQHPELKDEVITAFIKNYTERDFEKGLALTEKYGYVETLPFKSNPIIAAYYSRLSRGILGFLLGLIIMFLIITMVSYRNFYRRVGALTLGADKIMRGDFDVKLPEEGDGDLAMLGARFNQMAKRLHATLRDLEEERSLLKNMISDISHQLKTPLASLRTFNELLLDGAVEDPKVRQEFLERTMTQIDRMEWLIQTLLKISRLEAGVIRLEKNKNNLTETLQGVIDALRPKFIEKGQILETHSLDQNIHLPHDHHWVGEALENMINNAIDYTPNDGKIRVGIEETESFVRVLIQDWGMGIREEDLPHIFKRFYQGQVTRKASKEGSGIGLALSKLIVEKHGGFIKVKSKANYGSTFVIAFPKLGHLTEV